VTKEPYEMKFDVGTIKHLGLQMYSTLPPVIGELVANAWDADATRIEITIPTGLITDGSEITAVDDGTGMSDSDVRDAYLVVGRDKREAEGRDTTAERSRKVMGHKGIGKFAAFGIAGEMEIESIKKDEISRFRINYQDLKEAADKRVICFPALQPTGKVTRGTKITLRHIIKYRTRSIDVQGIRRGLARRFSVIGEAYNFEVVVNGEPITAEERDLQRLLQKDASGKKYLWTYDDVEIRPNTGWRVSGWIGALDRTAPLDDGIQRGIVVMARGKLVQEPFVFDATVGQQYALSYLVGELNAEFVDDTEDTISTTRNSLVWDAEWNLAFKDWGQKEVNRIAREWAGKRAKDNEVALLKNPIYRRFLEEAKGIENKRVMKVADALIKGVVMRDLVGDEAAQETMVQLCLDFMEFDEFWALADDVTQAELNDTDKIMQLFREWELVEAKEMMRVTKGRITTIEKLESLIKTNALEVPVLHNFLREFPWVLDPRWQLIADEKRFSDILRENFPDDALPEEERRIDFLCVREGTTLVVVEIKRPSIRASVKELDQIQDYVSFMRDQVRKTTDRELRQKTVVGYLLCGSVVDTWKVRERLPNLEAASIYVRLYSDLLGMVKRSHDDFLKRYAQLREARQPKNQA
jgi:hypothetical protein